MLPDTTREFLRRVLDPVLVVEWMGHRDLSTTQRYADYAPSSREVEMVAAAFKRPLAPSPVSTDAA